jgi:F-type H+-transporting ATPase subunit O
VRGSAISVDEYWTSHNSRTDVLIHPPCLVAANPTLSVSERSKLISSLASGSSPIITNLLQVLASNGRLAAFPSVITDFSTLMAAHRGQLVVTVTSAEPLAAGGAEMKRLEKALKGSKIAQGKDLKLVNRVNPGILGGLEVDFGEQTIDLSASSKVNKFNAALARESWS